MLVYEQSLKCAEILNDKFSLDFIIFKCYVSMANELPKYLGLFLI